MNFFAGLADEVGAFDTFGEQGTEIMELEALIGAAGDEPDIRLAGRAEPGGEQSFV